MPVFNDVVRLRCTQPELQNIVDYLSANGVGTSTYDYEPDQDEINVICTASRLEGIAGQAEKDDTINDQLAILNRKVAQDAVKVKNIPNKMQSFYTFLDNPNLDGENDHIRTKAERNKFEVKVPEINLREMNDQFEREGKRCINDIRGVIELPGNKREFLLDYAEVESG